jgi:hypothetical protein
VMMADITNVLVRIYWAGEAWVHMPSPQEKCSPYSLSDVRMLGQALPLQFMFPSHLICMPLPIPQLLASPARPGLSVPLGRRITYLDVNSKAVGVKQDLQSE